MANQELNVRIISPKKLIFEGKASAVSSKNSEGKFDILAEHANFITLINNSPILVKTPSQTLSFIFALAIIHTAGNQVNIYTDLDSIS